MIYWKCEIMIVIFLMKNKVRLFTLSVLHKGNHGFATK